MTKTQILKLIRAHCLDCCCNSIKEVQECPIVSCALHDLRFGKDPSRKKMNPEDAKTLGERLHKARTENKRTHTRTKNPAGSKLKGG